MPRVGITIILTVLMIAVASPLIRVEMIDNDTNATDSLVVPIPTDKPPIESNGLDNAYIRQKVAYPRIIFTPTETLLDVLPQELSITRYLVIPSRQGYEFEIDWSVIWENEAAGAAEVELIVSLLNAEDEWDEWTAAYDFIERDTATIHTDTLTARLDIFEPGWYEIRFQLIMTAYGIDDEPLIIDKDTYTSIHALLAPDEIAFDQAFFEHPLTELARAGLLVDGRAWHNFLCDVPREQDEIFKLTRLICQTLHQDNFEDAATYIYLLLDTTDHPQIKGQAFDILALINALYDDWEESSEQAGNAIGLWEEEFDALQLAISLHNHAIALYLTGEEDEAIFTLQQAINIREQLDDDAGLILSYAQLATKHDDTETVEELAELLQEFDAPQGDLLLEWAKG